MMNFRHGEFKELAHDFGKDVPIVLISTVHHALMLREMTKWKYKAQHDSTVLVEAPSQATSLSLSKPCNFSESLPNDAPSPRDAQDHL